MGLDVNLYAEANPTPEQLAHAEAFFEARTPTFGDPIYGKVLAVDDAEWHPTPRVVVSTMARFYGEHYERGDWPTIYGAIRVLQAAFPNAKVYYGSDSSDDGLECTPARLAEIWDHFLSPQGQAYRERLHP